MRIIIDQIVNGFTVTLMKSQTEMDTMFIPSFKEVTDHLVDMQKPRQPESNVVDMNKK